MYTFLGQKCYILSYFVEKGESNLMQPAQKLWKLPHFSLEPQFCLTLGQDVGEITRCNPSTDPPPMSTYIFFIVA